MMEKEFFVERNWNKVSNNNCIMLVIIKLYQIEIIGVVSYIYFLWIKEEV